MSNAKIANKTLEEIISRFIEPRGLSGDEGPVELIWFLNWLKEADETERNRTIDRAIEIAYRRSLPFRDSLDDYIEKCGQVIAGTRERESLWDRK